MIPIIPISDRGITYGTYVLIKHIEDYTEQVVFVIRVERFFQVRANEYTFIVLFREKGTIGQFTAFINEWGTGFGEGAGGTGSAGFKEIMSAIEDKNVELIEHTWKDVDEKLHEQLDSDSVYERIQAWQVFLMEMCVHHLWGALPNNINYPINDNWKDER